MEEIKVFGLEWHQKNSTSVRDFLIEPLSPYISFEFISWDCEAGIIVDTDKPVVFCQCLPPREVLLNPRNKIIYIPMWDGIYRYDESWWNNIPEHIRIISFSRQIDKLSEDSGHKTLSLQYFKDPGLFSHQKKHSEKHLFYWHRTNTYNACFIRTFCNKLQVKKLTLINRPDPGFRPFTDPEVKRFREFCDVTEVKDFIQHEEYFKYMSEANMFLAPRWLEGIGMSFIEAMCHGHCVFGVDCPTMNEYIIHDQNGVLFTNSQFYPTLMQKILNRSRRILKLTERDYSVNQPSVAHHQNWKEIKKLNYFQLGNNAQLAMQQGFQIWQSQLQAYHEFILNW